MSKSDDNTNELESYGVWVKNSTGGSENTETPADTSDELNLDDVGLDLPDFDDSDFSDMFKDEPQGDNSNALDDFGSEDDTTLSTDELANITDGFEVEQVDAPAESDDLDLGDFDIPETTEEANVDFGEEIDFDTEISDSAEETEVSEATETTDDDLSFDTEISDSSDDLSFDIEESPVTEDSSEVSFDLDDSLSDDSETQTEEVNFETEETEEAAEEPADTEEEISFGDDEEISLDDFMDDGFSDESVAAGNNGYEPGAEPEVSVSSGDTEELSLDDFMDGDSFESAPAEAKEAEPIEDEAPLDMDISFDDSADTVETEDNVSLDISDDDIDDDTDEVEETETEEVSLDDFGSSFTAEETSTPVADSSSENINTEDIDLSDFGIDADAEETPIVQDVEEAKNKEKIVDYDLAVGDENTATAPVVNEIKSDASDVSEVEEIAEEAAPVAEENTTSVDNSLLQQIVSELSSLKDEMNKLKTNLAEIKTHENTVSPAAVVAAGAAGIAAGAAAAAALSNDDIDPENAKEDTGGFFSEDDGDDTIALSFDELDNIMNTAEFGDTVEGEQQTEEAVTEEPVIEETSVDIEAEETVEEPVEETSDNTEIEEVAVDSDDTIIEESIISSEVEAAEESESVDTEIENAISDESDTSLDDITFDEDQSDNFDFSDEKLEEPKIDEFIPDGNDELYEGEELPDEISIPKEDDLLVESNSSDFMDSVKETTDEDETAAEFIAEDNIEEDTLDLPSELPDSIGDTMDAPAEESEIADDDIPTVDKLLNEEPEITEEPEETVVEEPVIEESAEEPVIEESAEEPVIEETAVEQEPFTSVENFNEVDNLDNNLSESNLAYLDKQGTDGLSDSIANADLKQDIKSVLLYMDQLLENLPEEKIVEFAKSDEFVTYKKLFNELGLS